MISTAVIPSSHRSGSRGDDAVECPFGRKGSDVQLVEHQILRPHPLPVLVRPSKPTRKYDGRSTLNPFRLPQRTRVRPLWTVIEPVNIPLAGGHASFVMDVIVVGISLHGELAPPVAVQDHHAHLRARGAHNRQRTEPSSRSTAPHRRPGRARSRPFMVAP